MERCVCVASVYVYVLKLHLVGLYMCACMLIHNCDPVCSMCMHVCLSVSVRVSLLLVC